MTQIGIDIAKENAVYNGRKLFNDELLLELSDYIVESSISDDVFLTASGLYSHVVKTLNDMQSVYVDFTISADVDFLNKLQTPNGFSNFIFLGAKIMIEDASGELAHEDGLVTLYGYTYTPRTNKISNLQFTNNKEAPTSSIRTIGNLAKQTNATKNLTDFYKATWEDTRKNNVNVGKIINEGLDLAAQKVRSRTEKNVIEIDEAGIFLIDATDNNNQLALINDLICMTTDRWKTCKIAISPEGIMAEQLLGKIILSEEVYVGNADNTFKILPEGLYVYDQSSSHELRVFLGIQNGKAKLELYSSSGDKSLVLSEEGIYNCYQISERDSFDFYKPFETSFFIPATLKETFEAKLIVNLDNFRAYSKSADSTTINLTTTEGTGDIDVSLSGVSSKAVGATVTGEETTVAWGHGGKMTSSPYGDGEGGGNIHLDTHTHHVVLEHSHGVELTMNSHAHAIELTGKAKADTHKHSIVMPSHEHDLIYGIYESGALPECEVYLGGSTGAHKVATLNDSKRFAIIDVKKQFEMLGTNQVHKVIIKTTNPKGLARASFTLFWGGFYNYY